MAHIHLKRQPSVGQSAFQAASKHMPIPRIANINYQDPGQKGWVQYRAENSDI